MRLEQRGLLDARWEFTEQRPRHVYRLTADGVALAQTLRTAPAPRLSAREAVA
jgi:DNA-binding PadR family transcriptional regulator